MLTLIIFCSLITNVILFIVHQKCRNSLVQSFSSGTLSCLMSTVMNRPKRKHLIWTKSSDRLPIIVNNTNLYFVQLNTLRSARFVGENPEPNVSWNVLPKYPNWKASTTVPNCHGWNLWRPGTTRLYLAWLILPCSQQLNRVESAGLKLGIQTFLLQTSRSAQGKRLIDWATKLVKLDMMAQRLARRAEDWEVPGFKSHPRLISQSWSSYQLNQLGSKAASDSTLKQLTLAGYQILVLYFLYYVYQKGSQCRILKARIMSLKSNTH